MPTLPDAHAQRPSWGPDGRLAWELNFHDSKRLQLFVGTSAGGERVLPPARARSGLTRGFQVAGDEGVAHELTWAPASIGAFAYSASTADDDHDLFIGAAAITRTPGADGGPAWSPDGAHLVFSSARTGEGDLYLLEVAKIEAPPRRLTTHDGSSEVHAAWSPDGRTVAYVAHTRTGDNLWWVGVDRPAEQLTTAAGSQLRPSFSPDGAHLAFYASVPETGRFALQVMAARPGAPARTLLDPVVVGAHAPVWVGPDALIAVVDEDDAFDPIARVDLRGERVDLALGTVGNRDLAVGDHDGQRWLAWTAQGARDGAVRDFRRLYVAPLP